MGSIGAGGKSPGSAASGGELLRRPAAESARRILLATLERVEEAEGRLKDETDIEALHDFRVGLRRLRSGLRAFHSLVEEDLPARAESRLRGIARATNRGRDAEVQAALLREWLRRSDVRSGAQRSGSGGAGAFAAAGSRAAASRMAEELERRRDELAVATIGGARRGLLKLAASLRPGLATYRVTVDLGAALSERDPAVGSFAGELARQVMAQWQRLREGFETVEGFDPPEPLHRLRIEAKRLRYLLEPLSGEEPEVDAPLRSLRSWQDLLGEFQDAVVLERRVTKRYLAAARRRARALVAEARSRGSVGASARARRQAPVSPRGFLPLLDLARARQRRSWTLMRRRWAGVPLLGKRIEGLCAKWSSLDSRASPE